MANGVILLAVKHLRKIGKGLSLILLGFLVYAGIRFGPDAWTAYQNGLFEKQTKTEYAGSSEDNLRALQTALLLFHESEGAFPAANSWMDAIEGRLQSASLKSGEAAKKLHQPGMSGDKYGYAFNVAASKKYKDDLGSGKTILVFESKDLRRNASGSPQSRSGLAITLDGTILKR